MSDQVVVTTPNSCDGHAIAADQVELGQAATGHAAVRHDDPPEVEHGPVEWQVPSAAFAYRIAEVADGRVGADHHDRVAWHQPLVTAGDRQLAVVLDAAEADLGEASAELVEAGEPSAFTRTVHATMRSARGGGAGGVNLAGNRSRRPSSSVDMINMAMTAVGYVSE